MYRLKKYKQGWIVEQEVCKLYLLFVSIKSWKHVTHYTGMPDSPFYYRTPEGARQGALDEIRDKINFSFHFSNIA